MGTKESKELVRKYLEELSGNEKPRSVLERYVSSEGFIEHILALEAGFPRYALEVHDLIAEDDVVAVRMTFRGRHLGDFQGLAPTGREATMEVAAFYRIERGKIAWAWVQADGASLVEQLLGEE